MILMHDACLFVFFDTLCYYFLYVIEEMLQRLSTHHCFTLLLELLLYISLAICPHVSQFIHVT